MRTVFFIILFTPSFIFSQNIEVLKGNINTNEPNFAFTQMNDTLGHYTSLFLDDDNYQALTYKARQVDGKWIKGEALTLGSFYSTANLMHVQGGEYIYFSFHKKNGSSKIARKSKSSGKIELLPHYINIENTINTQPFICFHQKTKVLYFASNRAGGFGGLDIWLSIIDTNNNFGIPINVGSNINSQYDEVTPFYHKENNRLYYSSNIPLGLGGLDIYSASGSLNLWDSIKNEEKFNSKYDECYLTFFTKGKGYFSSNRGNGTCVDVFCFNTTKKLMEKTLSEINLSKHLPLRLYFDNDQPDSCNIDTITVKNYRDLYLGYLEKKDVYIKKTKNQSLESFFTDSLVFNFNTLNDIVNDISSQLSTGKKVRIKVKGYASPLYDKKYNINLSKRRVSSFINFIKEYNSCMLKQHLMSGKLIIHIESFGESKSSKEVSDDPTSRRSIYSIGAMLERKIEITEITLE